MQDNPKVLIFSAQTDTFMPVLAPHLEGQEHVIVTEEAALTDALNAFQPNIAYSLSGGGISKDKMRPILAHPSVTWFTNGGSGVEHLQGHGRAGLTVCNMAGVLAPYLAEFALTGLMMGNINFPYHKAGMATQRWDATTWTSIVGKTLCIVGLGSVGRDLARQAANVGMRVIGVRASGAETPHVAEVYTPDRTDEAVAKADLVAVHAAETPDSIGLIGPSTFAAMKDEVVFLNAARGPVVDQMALTDALRKPGRIRCAILDVFDIEPLPQDDPIWGQENVVVTPHMADNVPGWPALYAECFAENLKRWRSGEPLSQVVDLNRGY